MMYVNVKQTSLHYEDLTRTTGQERLFSLSLITIERSFYIFLDIIVNDFVLKNKERKKKVLKEKTYYYYPLKKMYCFPWKLESAPPCQHDSFF
jgi:hypothetical protein